MAIRDWPFEAGGWHRPRREFERMFRLFDDLLGERLGRAFPPLNLWADDSKAVLTVEVPGVKPENLDVSVENDVATIRGSRSPEKVEEDESFLRHERGHRDFARSISLPFPVEADKVEATCNHGVLRVTLPRSEASKPKKIEIKG